MHLFYSQADLLMTACSLTHKTYLQYDRDEVPAKEIVIEEVFYACRNISRYVLQTF